MEYEVFIAPPIRLPRKPSPVELDAAAQQAITEMERYVRAHPTQWFHFESDASKSAVAASKRAGHSAARRGAGDAEPRAESGAAASTGESGR
jgi:hypothetical protein